MKNKLNLFTVLVLAGLLAVVPAVTGAQSATGTTKSEEHRSATSTVKATSTKGNNGTNSTSTKADNSQGEANRSVVATSVQKLLEVADRDGGIGAEVRMIAQEQKDSEATTTKAVKDVEDRSKAKTFLVGTDYKSIGAIRSEMVGTVNRIERLKRAADKLELGADKTELENQIKTLEEEQDKLEDFLNDNENKFSLFGWLARFFAE